MKFNLFLYTALSLLIGCGESNLDDPETLDKILAEAIDADKIQNRGKEDEKLFYAPNESDPYTGWVKKIYDNGQVSSLFRANNGKIDGLGTDWYKNGQKKIETRFKDGKLISYEVWKPNGEKCPVSNLVNGNGELVNYNDNGSENSRTDFENGKVSLKKKYAQNWVNGTGEAYVTTYFALVGEYPKSLADLKSPQDRITIVQNASDLEDPWGKPYIYQYPGTHNTESFDISTTAPDGTVISNW